MTRSLPTVAATNEVDPGYAATVGAPSSAASPAPVVPGADPVPAPAGGPSYTRIMERRGRQGPFRPGAGGLPPYLAGRESEQALCRTLLGDLADGLAPAREVVLHGPRGNGKTALLVWLEREAASHPGVDVLRLTPAAVPDEAKLVERLLPSSWRRRLTPREVSVRGITWRPGNDRPPPLDEALAARVRRGPLALLLDEAHTLNAETGCALLNASQQVGRTHPFLLVLAGTPGLRSHLNTMNASFWSRAERRAIGRLDPAASAAAIRNPLESDGIRIDEDALAHVVHASHGYPYFVQLWGEAIWRQAAGGEAPEAVRRVTHAAVSACQAGFDRARDDYYLDRYEELEKRRLLPVARAVADAFDGRPRMDDPTLDAALRQGLRAGPDAERVAAVRDTLRDLGYVWRPEAVPLWEPGIPSLMDYVCEYTPAGVAT